MRSFTTLSLCLTLSLVALFGCQVEAGKGSKRMMALAIMSMLQKNQKIIVPFPIPMPIKVYEKKYDYKEDYPAHGYGDNYGESGYASHGHHHHGDLAGAHSHAHHHHSHAFGAGSGVNYNYGGKLGGDHGAFGQAGFSSFPGASSHSSPSAHPTVYAYDGKVGNEYGPENGAAGNPHHFESHTGNEYHGATENFAPSGGY